MTTVRYDNALLKARANLSEARQEHETVADQQVDRIKELQLQLQTEVNAVQSGHQLLKVCFDVDHCVELFVLALLVFCLASLTAVL